MKSSKFLKLLILISLIDIFQINYIKVEDFSLNKWKSNKNRIGMTYSLIKQNRKFLITEPERNFLLGKKEFLNKRNEISSEEKYEYQIKGYKLFERGIILKKKEFLIFYNEKKNLDYIISKEYYLFNVMIFSEYSQKI